MSENKKILLISDAHIPTNNDLIKQKISKGVKQNDQSIYQGVSLVKKKFLLTLEKSRQYAPYNVIICGGDMLNGYKNQGLVSEDSQKGINELKAILGLYYPDSEKKYLTGNHEMGYNLAISKYTGQGITQSNIDKFTKNFNDLYFSFNINNFKFIGLSSDLEYIGEDNPLFSLRQEQHAFLKNTLDETEAFRKIVLLLHDPSALASLYPLLKDYTNIIVQSFSGHNHSSLLNTGQKMLTKISNFGILRSPLKMVFNMYSPKKGEKIYNYFRSNKELNSIWKNLKLETIPAPSGFKFLGGGGLVLSLSKNDMEIDKFTTPEISYIRRIKH